MMFVSPMVTIGKLITTGSRYLADQGISNPRLEAEVLLSYILRWERIQLYVRWADEVSCEDKVRFQNALEKRGQHMPAAYITGIKEFYGLELAVNENVLIPRPETELLVDWLLALCQEKSGQLISIIDIGTGSGAISIALAYNLLEKGHECFHIYAADISQDALKIAAQNAVRWQVDGKVEFVESDLFENLPHTLKKNVDIIVSNPPYIPTEDLNTLPRDILGYEPVQALDGGPAGLAFYPPLLTEGRHFLKNEGWMVFEIGHGQGDALTALAQQLDCSAVELHFDHSGKERMVIARWG